MGNATPLPAAGGSADEPAGKVIDLDENVTGALRVDDRILLRAESKVLSGTPEDPAMDSNDVDAACGDLAPAGNVAVLPCPDGIHVLAEDGSTAVIGRGTAYRRRRAVRRHRRPPRRFRPGRRLRRRQRTPMTSPCRGKFPAAVRAVNRESAVLLEISQPRPRSTDHPRRVRRVRACAPASAWSRPSARRHRRGRGRQGRALLIYRRRRRAPAQLRRCRRGRGPSPSIPPATSCGSPHRRRRADGLRHLHRHRAEGGAAARRGQALVVTADGDLVLLLRVPGRSTDRRRRRQGPRRGQGVDAERELMNRASRGPPGSGGGEGE